MKTPDQTRFAPVTLAAQAPPVARSRRPADPLGCRARRAALLLLCLGGWLIPLGASAQSQPVVSLFEVPADVLIGENFTFKIKFKNLSTTPGYGPFIDLVLDAAGADAGTAGQPCDGVSFVSARLLTGGPLTLGTIQRLAPCPTTISSVCVPLFSHPFGAAAPLSLIGARPGSELQTLILPFGHYESTQPELEIEVTARVSVLADANFPLSLSVRGGFRYGDSPTGSTPIVSEAPNLDSCSWTVRTTVNPTAMKVGKRYLGPELEAVSGPNFVSYYPLQYALTNDIAAGQTITNLVIQDLLPPTLVYHGNLTVTINGNLAVVGTDYTLVTTPPVTVSFLNPITGSAAPNEVVVTFEFWIPFFDSFGTPILGPGCAAAITNVVQASGDWTPVDVRDVGPVHLVAGPVTNLITAKCLAVQKTVRLAQPGDYLGAVSGDSGPAGLTPGDLLRYEFRFQVSDYKTIGDLVLTDWLSDGQVLDVSTAPFPQLTVQDQFGIVQGAFNVANFGTAPGQAWRMDPNVLSPCTPPGFPAGLRADRYTFNLSQLMMNQAGTYPRHAAGILTGGIASFPPSATPGPAVGTLVFYARVADRFIYPVPGDSFVDKHDPLVNCVVIQGTLFPNANAPAVPVLPAGPAPITTSDDSGTGLRVVGSPFTKTIYAVNGLTTGFLNPPHLAPGHTVTFRLTKTIPSGDAENVVLRDFPPLPVLKVADPTANGSTPWTFLPSPFPPLAGQWSVGPGHTAPVPVFSVGTPNELTFTVGSFNNPLNTPLVVDLYFTMRVGGAPIADGLFLTNEAVEREENSFHETFAQVALAQIKTAEPNLRITKGVVATSDGEAVFTQAGQGGLVFSPPGTSGCPRFSGAALNSTSLPAFPQLTSDICHLRTNARVTFAIVVENLGSSPFGAFDVTILDTLPACFRDPQNLCITDGNGSNLATTGGLFTTGLNLTDVAGGAGGPGMGAVGPFSLTSGRNLAVITFDATYVGGCCANHAQLLGYSNQEGGSNFVTAGLVTQAADDAGICCDVLTVNWPPDKTVQCGSVWSFGVPVAVSSCSGDKPTITILNTVTNGTLCLQTITRTWQVTDACLNTTNHVQTVLVTDTTPPVLACVAGKTVQCGAKWVFDAPTAADACSGTNVTITILSTATNGTACAQQVTRTWLAVDACGNTNTCTQTVTIVDTTPPVFVAVPTTGAGTVGTFSALAAWQTAAGTTTTIDFSTLDNGNPITPGTDTFFPSLLLAGAEFVNVRSYYNSFIYVTANAPIRVNLPPGTFAFGADIGLFYPLTGAFTITLSDGQVFTVPNTGQDFFGAVAAAPIAWVEFRFNNSGVLLLDNFSFAALTPAATGPAEKTVPCGTPWSFDPPIAYDACGGTNVTITVLSTVTNGPCPRITRTWVATDACGNTNTISQTVIIVDTTPPVFGSATGQSYGPPVTLPGLGTDPVQAYGINDAGQLVGSSFGSANNGLVWTPTSATSGVYVNAPMTLPKGTAPFVLAFAINSLGQVIGADNGFPNAAILWTPVSGVYGAPVQLPAGVASGINTSGVIVGVASGGGAPVYWIPVSGVYNLPTSLPLGGLASLVPAGINDAGLIVGGAGTGAVLWTPVSGVYGAPSLLPAGIYGVSVAAKGINAAGQIVGVGNAGLGQRPILWTPVSGVYGAPVELPILNSGPWQATGINAAGQIVGFNAAASVLWLPLPGVTCPTNKTVQCGTAWSFDPPAAFDACSGTNVTLTILSTVTNGTCPQVITRTWQAVDACGNKSTNTCSQTVTVVDTTPPVFTCSTNKTVQCGTAWSFDPPTAFDACSGTNVTVTIVSTVTNGTCPQVITRTWRAVDACGNPGTNSCSQTVTVVDTTPPQLLGCLNLSTNAFPGLHGNYVTYAITAVDTCPGAVTLTCTPPSGSFFPIGTNLVLCTAVDACGNTRSCEFTVTVGPAVDPCVLIVRELILCRTNGGYSYTFSLTNQGADTIAGLVFVDLPAGVTVTPAAISLATPLAPGQGTTVTTTIHLSALAPTNVCFRIMAHDKAFVECCIVRRCLTFPECKTLGPTLSDAVFVGGKFTFTLWAEMGVIYLVEYSTTLSPTNWLLSHTIVGNGSLITIMPRIDAPAPRLFYRVRQE